MTRRFFDQIDDELRGLLGPAMRGFRSVRTSSLIKVWYGESSQLHFEAQQVGSRWAPAMNPVMEIGIHVEHPAKQTNDKILENLMGSQSRWKKKLPMAEGGKAFGPRSRDWRRISELTHIEHPDDPDFAGEVAEIMASYIKVFKPLIEKLEINADDQP